MKGSVSLGVDFVPVVGDIKSFAEAQSAIDYLAATIGLVPLVGDVAGDLEQAFKLINDASHEINVKWVDENAGMSSRAGDYNDSASGARSNIDT